MQVTGMCITLRSLPAARRCTSATAHCQMFSSGVAGNVMGRGMRGRWYHNTSVCLCASLVAPSFLSKTHGNPT